MLIVAGSIDVAPERRDEFLADREPSILRTRGESGCIEYVFSADSLNKGRVRIFEIWESRPQLDDHLKVMASDPPASDVAMLSRELHFYEISSVE